jgi:TolB-like protein
MREALCYRCAAAIARAVLVIGLAASSSAPLAAPRTKVAVTDIKAVQGVSAGTATILSDIVVSEVARAGHDVVSQSDINAMIGFERQRKMLGCSDDSSCLAEIGGALGVDYMLAGQVGQIGTRFRISLLLVDSKKARVAARAAQFCDQNEDALAKAAEATVRELLRSMAAPAATAQAAPPASKLEQSDAKPPQVKPSLEAKPPREEPAAVAVAATSGTGRRSLRLPAYVTMGSGGALFLVGALTGVAAKSRYSNLESQRGDIGYYDTYQAKKGGIRSLAIAADVLMLGGVATAGVGGWMFWRAGRTPLAVVPSAGDGSIGLVASGAF